MLISPQRFCRDNGIGNFHTKQCVVEKKNYRLYHSDRDFQNRIGSIRASNLRREITSFYSYCTSSSFNADRCQISLTLFSYSHPLFSFLTFFSYFFIAFRDFYLFIKKSTITLFLSLYLISIFKKVAKYFMFLHLKITLK
jgi:hypothetical protein